MKKSILLVAALTVFAGLASKAQNPPPTKQQTTKPVKSTVAKSDAVNAYLIIDGQPGPSDKTNKSLNQPVTKSNVTPTTVQQTATRPTPPQATAPRPTAPRAITPQPSVQRPAVTPAKRRG